MNEEEIFRQYDVIGPAYIAAQKKFYSRKEDEPSRFIEDSLSAVNGSFPKLLDVGCGDGHDIVKYEKMGYDCYGVDSSKEMVREARKHVKNPDNIYCCSMTHLPFSKSSMAAITGRFSLHYLENVDDAYWEFNHVLMPGGLVIMVVGHPLNNFLKQKKKRYGRQEVIENRLYNETVTIRNPSHTFSDYFSPIFLEHFTLEKLYEGRQHNDIVPDGFETPCFLGFVGRKR